MNDIGLWLILACGGILAGYIDAIAGGGGLITIPLLSLVLGTGAETFGTNKVVGSAAAISAFLVYYRRGHMNWYWGLRFGAAIAAGSLLGSQCASFLPSGAFRWIIICLSPLLLWVVYRKDLWLKESPAPLLRITHQRLSSALTAGFACGFYDGIFGPAGGTFMLLALAFVVRLPLLEAIATSKFINAVSALAALGNFSRLGLVHWQLGFFLATMTFTGAYFGAKRASVSAAKIVRPMLLVVVLLLLIKVVIEPTAIAP